MGKGAFTSDAVAVHGPERYPVRVIEGKGFSRKEVDGRKVSDEPLGTFSLVIHRSAMPAGISRSHYALLKFEVEGIAYTVSSFWGYSVLRFVLKAAVEHGVDGASSYGGMEIGDPVEDWLVEV